MYRNDVKPWDESKQTKMVLRATKHPLWKASEPHNEQVLGEVGDIYLYVHTHW